MKIIRIIVLIQCILLTQVVHAQLADKNDRMQWWRSARFGMFIHWGVYAQWAGVYNGHEQRKGGAEWILNRGKIPVAVYREKAKSFNPINYRPDEWVRMAKSAGMKYIIITAKHHDGFALFKSEASKWNVVDATAYGKDLLKPLVKACKEQGMPLGFYYSQAQDWTNPGGAASRKLASEAWLNPDSSIIDSYTLAHNGHWDPVQETGTFEQYVKTVAVPQVKELLTHYGKVAVLWWDTPTNMTVEAARELSSLLSLQPDIITNDRLKKPDFPGDIATPEQKIPGLSEIVSTDWETCMTMNGTWGFRTSDTNWKSPSVLIRNLCDIASKGGNYLLNVGPMADGSIPEASIQILGEIGKWMQVNGESIYDTHRAPFPQPEWGRFTEKNEQDGSTLLYLQIFNWPANGQIVFPLKTKSVHAIHLLSGNQNLTYQLSDNTLTIQVPSIAPDRLVNVIRVNYFK
ncbi:MAG: alpha-L-fucosidase [Sediminibacterium sp.]|nr:alpha-L-fucosidase [Sediminibacterium sp.]